MGGRKIIVGLSLVLIASVAAFPQDELGDPIPFSFQGTTGRVIVRSVLSGSVVILQTMEGETQLCPAAGGENLFPEVQVFKDRFFVMWAHYENEETGLGIYDSRTADGRIIPLPGLSFLGSPKMVLQGQNPRGVMILGNSPNNDDIFFLDLSDCSLTNLTNTPASEKGFVIQPAAGGLLVSTATLWEKVFYYLNLQTLQVEIRERWILKPRAQALKRTLRTDETDCVLDNTYIAFGDSITWGEMRMYGLEGEYHPELAYPERVKALLAAIYGPAYPINLGVPGEDAYGGTLRINQELDGHPGLYFLLMLGTNDCYSGKSSINSIIENIDYIIESALSRRMRVIVSTIPPRKDRFGDIRYVRRRIANFNDQIATLASDKIIGFIDTHKAFMDFNPPEGWKILLEDVGGNHPSPAGHRIIARLFANRLAAFPPGIPSRIERSSEENISLRKIGWGACCESDFALFKLEFGPAPSNMTGKATTTNNGFDFSSLPYRDIFFRIQSADKAGHLSLFSIIYVFPSRAHLDDNRPSGE